jgi:hypothetical protein
MVGVPRGTGCATCRKRSVKVSKIECCLQHLLFLYSAMKFAQRARNADGAVVHVQVTYGP